VHVPADKSLERVVEESEEVSQAMTTQFRALHGALLFIFITVRPEAGYAVGMLSRVVSKPSQAAMDAAVHVLMYLYSTRDLGLRYARGNKTGLFGMSDSDWGVRASISAYVFMLAGAIISFLSKKQPTIAMDSTMAEIYATSQAGLEACFLRVLIAELLGLGSMPPTALFVDNSGAVAIANDFISNSRVRHYTRRHLKVRELVEDSVVAVLKIGTDDNIADLLSKALGRRRFEKLRRLVLNM